MKSHTITETSYQKLLQKIQEKISKTQQNITRQKVEMAWEIGKLVDENLLENREEAYGKNLILRLEKDVQISESTLYKMRAFYQSYPELPKDEPSLNWSHYRVLAGVADEKDRKDLEYLVKENDWSGDLLQKKVGEIKKKNLAKIAKENSSKIVKLNFSRGKLFSYKMAQVKGSSEVCLDLGFKIFHKISSDFAVGEIVESVKNSEKYSLKKSTISTKEMYTYKAFVERVVDGDTLVVSLDLGFGILHEEILRLAQINAPESASKEGKKATKKLKEILKDVEFVVIKTNKSDIYGRYIADVFLGEGDVDEIASDGEYLSQMLLNSGVVEFAKY
jgi:endonuclease YncB( thermonuclease family)